MITDTHCHLDFERTAEDREAVLERARAAGVSRLITVGTDVGRSKQAVEIAGRYEYVWATVGVHPDAAGEVNGETLQTLADLATQPNVVAIGEIGIDLYHTENPPLDVQQSAFRQQAEIAARAGVPIVVHSRKAAVETLALLGEVASELPEPGVLHCFEGDLTFARSVLDRGFALSFTANVTYPKNQELREVMAAVPIERIMVETDAPFLPPQPLRGKRNEPANVRTVLDVLAEVKNISFEDAAATTSGNATRIFRLPNFASAASR